VQRSDISKFLLPRLHVRLQSGETLLSGNHSLLKRRNGCILLASRDFQLLLQETSHLLLLDQTLVQRSDISRFLLHDHLPVGHLLVEALHLGPQLVSLCLRGCELHLHGSHFARGLLPRSQKDRVTFASRGLKLLLQHAEALALRVPVCLQHGEGLLQFLHLPSENVVFGEEFRHLPLQHFAMGVAALAVASEGFQLTEQPFHAESFLLQRVAHVCMHLVRHIKSSIQRCHVVSGRLQSLLRDRLLLLRGSKRSLHRAEFLLIAGQLHGSMLKLALCVKEGRLKFVLVDKHPLDLLLCFSEGLLVLTLFKDQAFQLLLHRGACVLSLRPLK